jgi:hypothetical protein
VDLPVSDLHRVTLDLREAADRRLETPALQKGLTNSAVGEIGNI